MSTNYPQGPQGQPTNPFVQPQPQPPKKKHTLRNLLIGGGVLMALVVGGCSAALAGGADDTTGAAVPAKPAASAPAQVEKPAEKQADEPKAEKSQPKEEKESKPKVVKVSAGKLVKAFEDNELKADTKYKGKTLQVTGVVDEVDTEFFDEDKYILRVGTGDEWDFLTVNFYDIPADALADVDKGDKVTVVGEFDDGGDLGVIIRNAHVKS